LNKPFGIAFYPSGANPNWVYIANADSIVRFPYKNGDLTATDKLEHIVEKILSPHHWARDLVFSADGTRMFLGVGSGSNVALDIFPEPKIDGGLAAWKKTKPLGSAWDTEERRADVLSFTPEGKDEHIFATGLRNCAGLTVQPATGDLWYAVNERDEIGDDVPFEYATKVKAPSTGGRGFTLVQTGIRDTQVKVQTSRRRSPSPTCCWRHTQPPCRLLSTMGTISLRNTRVMHSSRCMGHGTGASAAATKSFDCFSRTTKPTSMRTF